MASQIKANDASLESFLGTKSAIYGVFIGIFVTMEACGTTPDYARERRDPAARADVLRAGRGAGGAESEGPWSDRSTAASAGSPGLEGGRRGFRGPEPDASRRAQTVQSLTDEGASEVQAPLVDPYSGHRMRVGIADAPTRGARDPLVDVVVFSDFTCTQCKQLNPTLDRLLRTYPNDLRLAFRHQPDAGRGYSMVSAESAVAAYRHGGNNAFWHMHDLLFAHQEDLSELDLRVHAVSVGMELDAFEAALAEARHRSTVERDQGLGEGLGVTASPTVFVNGRRIAGRQPYARYQRVVQEELRHGRRLVRAGVERNEVHDTLMRSAVPPEPVAEQQSQDL